MSLLVSVFYQRDDEKDTAAQEDYAADEAWHAATHDTCSYKESGTHQKENPAPEMEFPFPVSIINGHNICL